MPLLLSLLRSPLPAKVRLSCSQDATRAHQNPYSAPHQCSMHMLLWHVAGHHATLQVLAEVLLPCEVSCK